MSCGDSVSLLNEWKEAADEGSGQDCKWTANLYYPVNAADVHYALAPSNPQPLNCLWGRDMGKRPVVRARTKMEEDSETGQYSCPVGRSTNRFCRFFELERRLITDPFIIISHFITPASIR